MSDSGASSQPVLADPVVSPPSPLPVGTIPAGVAAGAFVLFAFWWLIPGAPLAVAPPAERYIPHGAGDLGPGVVTPVDARNPAALRAAVSALKLPEHQRDAIAQDVLAGRRRIGWVVVTDSMDPDGDVVAVEGGGIVQAVTLTKTWTPVPVLLDETHRIAVTAVKDGEGGGVTVVLQTAGAPVVLRAMPVGERLEVAAP